MDDHDILRYGLRALLRDSREVQVVGEADSVAQAIERAAELAPDVVLMDARLPDGSGVEACREILSGRPSARVLFFSGYSDEHTVLAAMLAGAHGHVSKDLDVKMLLDAIRKVARGGLAFDESLRGRVGEAIRSPAAAVERLSPQEERVMALVVEGKTNKEIAAHLSLSDKTVKNYLHNAFQKLGVGRRAQAVSVFDRQRLLRAGEDIGGRGK